MRQKAELLKSLPYDSLAFGSTPLIVSVESEKEKKLPTDFVLYQNYPNPFNPSTKIIFTLTTNTKIKLKVFDLLGQEVALLTNREYEPGQHEIIFDGSNLASGVYFYNLQTPTKSVTKKMALLK